jgi:RecJ-like exonuclease
MVLCTANQSGFEAILASYMRPFFAFLGLLFCLTPIRADEQAVIKDSDAIRYVGRYVEVRGVVVSVTTSPLGTAFINFGREYPDQTFAGFVAADSKMPTEKLTTLQGKVIGIVGTVELHEGKPEIKVMSMYQIIGLNSKLTE